VTCSISGVNEYTSGSGSVEMKAEKQFTFAGRTA
jgi:hypothetical protein